MFDSLYKLLGDLENSGSYPIHIQGHKRNHHIPGFGDSHEITYDITEIEGFDDLHHAQGIIKKENQRIADIYGTKSSYMLVNGSSSGLLSALACVTNHGEIGRAHV